jgi:predicted small secreted protein
MKSFILMAAVILLPLMTSACNTMAGAGEDISKGGQSLENSAEEHKHY